MSLPVITVVGNMKRIEMKYTASGKAVTRFQIECAEKNAKGEWTNLYLSGECWEKQAEFVNQYFQDGSNAIVTGKLYTNVYENQEGKKIYENKLLFPSVSFVPKDKNVGQPEQGGNDQGSYSPQQPSQQYNAPQQSHQPPQDHKAYQDKAQQGYKKQEMPDELPGIDMDDDIIPFGYIGLQYPRSLYVI